MPTPQGQYRHGPPPRLESHGSLCAFSTLPSAEIGRLVTPLVTAGLHGSLDVLDDHRVDAAAHFRAAREWTT
jgi:hypothetical protein